MSLEPEKKAPRYSLRPKTTAFDLCINRNRYGLVRRTIGRQANVTTEAKCQPKRMNLSPCTSGSSSPSSSRSRSPSPLPDTKKRKIRLESIDINDNETNMSTVQSNDAIMIVPKVQQPPNRTTQMVRKPPPTTYDVTKGNQSYHF